MDIFKSESFAESLSQNLKEGPPKMNSGLVDIYLSRPFCNENTGIMHWSVIYGNLSGALMIKFSFMSGYVRTILTSLKFKNEDLFHTGSYYDINIQSIEFGDSLRWKRVKKEGKKTGTVSWMSFVISCKISDEDSSLTRLRRILDKVVWAMKARTHNPLGPILFEHCQKKEEGVFNYFMNKNHNNEEAIKEEKTVAVDSTFKNGYNLKVHSHLNQLMIDNNIIHILKNDMKYSSWSDVSNLEHAICFKNYSMKKALPDWNMKKRPTTVTKCKSLLWLDIFLDPKNIQIYSLFFAEVISSCTS
jgi:hypothetical protein